MGKPIDAIRWPWLVALLLGAVSPLVLNVALLDLVAISPIAETVQRWDLFPERASFLGVVRILTGVTLGFIVAVIFGLPLGFIGRRSVGVVILLFIIATLGASLIWHLSNARGLAGFIEQWSWPEMWLSLFAVGLVAFFVSRYRSSSQVQRVAP
jgi:hypothetical protein